MCVGVSPIRAQLGTEYSTLNTRGFSLCLLNIPRARTPLKSCKSAVLLFEERQTLIDLNLKVRDEAAESYQGEAEVTAIRRVTTLGVPLFRK